MNLISKVIVTAILLCSSLSVFASSWTYKVNPSKEVETMCIDPNGKAVGGWRNCKIDLTCNQAKNIQHRCEMRHGGAKLGWHYAVNDEKGRDHETKCIKPNGDFIGNFRDCYTDKTCNNYEAIRDVCRVTYEK